MPKQKKAGKWPKDNHEIGRAGKQFDGGKFGPKRGSNKSWVDSLSLPKSK